MHLESEINDAITGSQPEQVVTDNAFSQPQTDEIGGVNGPEPTRFGDWEKNGRCVDF